MTTPTNNNNNNGPSSAFTTPTAAASRGSDASAASFKSSASSTTKSHNTNNKSVKSTTTTTPPVVKPQQQQQQQHTESISLDHNSWVSLLGLLEPMEFFVTVDHSVLWARHIAWAKPKGADLKHFITQRYASNMVFLSLLLGAQLGLFFNSSVETTAMRESLGRMAYGELKYWIGLVLLLDACITIVTIVMNFTLWGMIAALSDANTHCLVRSSIGQYVTGLPPRLIVSSLYLFLTGVLLFVVQLVQGPFLIVIMSLVLWVFFQVVIPLSAFGRLILHTGAMSKRKVLDERLEQELLPSGLHASLLLKATDQRRKHKSTIAQYASNTTTRANNHRMRNTSTMSPPVTPVTKTLTKRLAPSILGGSRRGSDQSGASTSSSTGNKAARKSPMPPPPPPLTPTNPRSTTTRRGTALSTSSSKRANRGLSKLASSSFHSSNASLSSSSRRITSRLNSADEAALVATARLLQAQLPPEWLEDYMDDDRPNNESPSGAAAAAAAAAANSDDDQGRPTLERSDSNRSVQSTDFEMPSAEILNQTSSVSNLKSMVESTLSQRDLRYNFTPSPSSMEQQQEDSNYYYDAYDEELSDEELSEEFLPSIRGSTASGAGEDFFAPVLEETNEDLLAAKSFDTEDEKEAAATTTTTTPVAMSISPKPRRGTTPVPPTMESVQEGDEPLMDSSDEEAAAAIKTKQQEAPTPRRPSSAVRSSRRVSKRRSSAIPPSVNLEEIQRASFSAARQSFLLGTRASTFSVQQEWQEENDIRDLYGAPKSADLLTQDEMQVAFHHQHSYAPATTTSSRGGRHRRQRSDPMTFGQGGLSPTGPGRMHSMTTPGSGGGPRRESFLGSLARRISGNFNNLPPAPLIQLTDEEMQESSWTPPHSPVPPSAAAHQIPPPVSAGGNLHNSLARITEMHSFDSTGTDLESGGGGGGGSDEFGTTAAASEHDPLLVKPSASGGRASWSHSSSSPTKYI